MNAFGAHVSSSLCLGSCLVIVVKSQRAMRRNADPRLRGALISPQLNRVIQLPDMEMRCPPSNEWVKASGWGGHFVQIRTSNRSHG
jgi:hypothetical protein